MREGTSQRSVARRFGVGLATVQLWLARAAERPLDKVDWADRSSLPLHRTRTRGELEDLVLDVRRWLREESTLGEYGPAAIRRELEARSDLPGPLPALRTIARILDRRGVLDARQRVRRPAPPAGWYLPDVRERAAELDSFDVISGLQLKGGVDFDVLTGISLHGGLTATWVQPAVSAVSTVRSLHEHWQLVGQPTYAQFDNDTRFIGGNAHPNSIGPVIRFCLAVGVVPVFAPPVEMGFQAAIEAYNGRWQRKLWARFWDPSLLDLQVRSEAYVAASRRRSAIRIEAAPARRLLDLDDLPDLTAPPAGRLVFLRRTSDAGNVSILRRSYPVDPRWLHRLVRGELDLDSQRLRFFALRRREPTDQPLLGEVTFEPPARWFR
ncbi:MAG: hypothetical protein E6I94_04025 [Chloroflexi bacterium]|nr:MAG: hypothetical protein E6I94_04025 [Chloroflexota bacterium]